MRMKAQANLEMIMILGAVLLMILATANYLPSNLASSQILYDKEMAADSVKSVAQAANEVSLGASGNLKMIWITMPESFVQAGSFIGSNKRNQVMNMNRTININVTGVGDVFAVSRMPICGFWPNNSGRYQVNVRYSTTNGPHVMVNGNC